MKYQYKKQNKNKGKNRERCKKTKERKRGIETAQNLMTCKKIIIMIKCATGKC